MALTTAGEVATVLKAEAADPAFLKAYQAAERWVGKRCTWTTETVTEGEPPVEVEKPVEVEDLIEAVILMTGRYMARRNSPDGLVGMGEFGVMRVSAIDRDVQSLIAKNRKIVL